MPLQCVACSWSLSGPGHAIRRRDRECRCLLIVPGQSPSGALNINDHEIDVVTDSHDAVEDRVPCEAAVPGLTALAHDDDLDGIFLGKGPHGGGDIGPAEGHGDAAKLLGELEILAEESLG